jgi:hypothetical protein
MSSRLSAALLLQCLAVFPLAGQAAPGGPRSDELRRLEARADSLARLWTEADALANLADSLEHAGPGGRTDTLAVGSLRIISNASSLPLREAAARAWPAIDSLYGSAAKALESRPYMIHAIDPDSSGRGRASWGIEIPWDKGVKELANLLLVYTPIPAPDRPFRDWHGDVVRPSFRGAHSDLEQSYVALVTSPYIVGRDCYLGSLESCRSALGLDDPPDPTQVFRTPAERQAALQGYQGTILAYRETGPMATLQGCQAGKDSACIELMRLLTPARLPRPVSGIARQTLVASALRLGGREAYRRLLTHPEASMAERLSQAAAVPLDTLLARWRSDVLAARPAPVALPPFGPLVGLGWTVLFGLCALRSSRWRAG